MSHFKITPLLLFVLFSLMLKKSSAQNTEIVSTPWFVSLNYMVGENKPHSPILENLSYPYRGVEAKLGWQSVGKQPWQVAFRYPSYGLGLNWSTFQTDILGSPFALYFFTNFPQLTTPVWQLNLEVDLGFSYGINPYHAEDNPHNFATGSSGNAFFGLYLENTFNAGKHLDLFASAGIIHYSNGAVGWPNYGLNIIPGMKLGLRYQPNYVESLEHNKVFDYERNWLLNVYVAGGRKMLLNPNNVYHEVLISPALYYRAGYKRRVGIAYELSYNQAITGVYTRRYESGTDLIMHAALLSHEFLINKFTILTQFGVYIHNLPFDKVLYSRFDIDCIISRFGIGYYIAPWARTTFSLKSHYIKAEYLELGMIFDINLSK